MMPRGDVTRFITAVVLCVWVPVYAQVDMGGASGSEPPSAAPGEGLEALPNEPPPDAGACPPGLTPGQGSYYDQYVYPHGRASYWAWRDYRALKRARRDRYRAWLDRRAEARRRWARRHEPAYVPRYLDPPAEREDASRRHGSFFEEDEGEYPYELGRGAMLRF
jgi:hypothetical protein